MISLELTEKAGLRLIGEIARLSRTNARMVLESKGMFTPEEIEELLTVCKGQQTHKTQKVDYFYQRRKAMAAFWVLGCSWAQIGELFQVSRQTVMDGAHKVMGGRRDRLATKCTYERLSEYNSYYWQVLAKSEINTLDLDVWELANIISQAETDHETD